MRSRRFTTETLVPDAKIFGPALADIRKALDVTQRELAEHARLPESSVAAYEARHRNPSLPALVRMAVACGVDPSSAVFHARLYADDLAMSRAKTDARITSVAATPALVLAPVVPLAAAAVAIAATKGVPTGLAAGGLARAVRDARYKTYRRPTDRNEYKLFEAALSAEPVPAAVEAGIYPLMSTPTRETLDRELVVAARNLSDEEMFGLVAALKARAEVDKPSD